MQRSPATRLDCNRWIVPRRIAWAPGGWKLAHSTLAHWNPAHRTQAHQMLAASILLAWTLAAGTPAPASAQVYLNELTVRPAGASERVELYNAGADPVDVAGWTIRGSKGSFVIPPPAIISPGEYFAVDVGDISGERGGITSLIDLLSKDGLVPAGRDSVHYGQEGSAPLPPEGTSLCRAPDASFGPPPPPDPDTDGLVWTLDLTPTFGAQNDAPQPQPGQGVLYNEISAPDTGATDLELFNPQPFPLELDEWFITNGAEIQFIAGLVPPNGFYLVTAEFDLQDPGLLYLFRSDGVRVDQLGYHDGPDIPAGDCIQRCPDGAEPYLGYNWATSGGFDTLYGLPCTLGGSNGPACEGTSGIEEHLTTWGKVKQAYRGHP